MNILSHRGFWLKPEEKNSEIAFLRSLDAGFGIETDIRDYAGSLVISHDLPKGDEMPFDDFLDLVKKTNPDVTLAINVKSDGLQELLISALDRHNIKSYFVFDMSIPDTLHYIKSNITTFVRYSEYEKQEILMEKSAGIWLDMFNSDWVTEKTVEGFLIKGKKVALVSPELHKRDSHSLFWSRFKNQQSSDLYICTDFPNQADSFFRGVKS